MTAQKKVVQLFKDDKKLSNESPLIVLPSLATLIGLNEAIVLQQLHYRSRVSKVVIDGVEYCGMCQGKLAESFPFWSLSTALRAFSNLEAIGVLVKAKKGSKAFCRVDYEALEAMMIGDEPPIEDEDEPDEEAETHVNLTKDTCQIDMSLLYKEEEGFKKWQPASGCGSKPTADSVVKKLNPGLSIEATLSKYRQEPEPNTTRIAQAWLELVGVCKRLHDDKAKMPPALTIKQKGQLGQLRKRLGPERTMGLVLASVPRWPKVVSYVKLHAGLEHVPKSPDIGFLVKHCGLAEDARHKGSNPPPTKKKPAPPPNPPKAPKGGNDSTEMGQKGGKAEEGLVSLEEIIGTMESDGDDDDG